MVASGKLRKNTSWRTAAYANFAYANFNELEQENIKLEILSWNAKEN